MRRQVKAWYDGLPFGGATEKLLTIVRAIFGYARPLEGLRPVADGVVEAPAELPFAEAELVGQLIGAHPRIAQPHRRRLNGAVRRPRVYEFGREGGQPRGERLGVIRGGRSVRGRG